MPILSYIIICFLENILKLIAATEGVVKKKFAQIEIQEQNKMHLVQWA